MWTQKGKLLHLISQRLIYLVIRGGYLANKHFVSGGGCTVYEILGVKWEVTHLS